MMAWNSTLKPSAKPMRRSGFKVRYSASNALTIPVKPNRMKRNRPKMTPIRRAARGQDCTLRLPRICNFDPETTVLCHSPYLKDGRGMGLKSSDECAVFGCKACHDVLDRRVIMPLAIITPKDIEAAFQMALKRTHEVLEMMGLIL